MFPEAPFCLTHASPLIAPTVPPVTHTRTPAGSTRHLTPHMIGLYAWPARPPPPNPTFLSLPSCKCCIFGLFLFLLLKVTGVRVHKLPRRHLFSPRMSPTVAESSGSNYQYNAGDSPAACVCVLMHIFSDVRHRRRGEAGEAGEEMRTLVRTLGAHIDLDLQGSRNSKVLRTRNYREIDGFHFRSTFLVQLETSEHLVELKNFGGTGKGVSPFAKYRPVEVKWVEVSKT